MSSGIDIPVYYQGENEYIKSSSSPILTGISVKWQNFKKSTAASKIMNLIILLVLIFVAIICWMNMVAYIKIINNANDLIDIRNETPIPTVGPIPAIYQIDPYDGVSYTWCLLGAIVNGIIAVILTGLVIVYLIKLFKDEKQVEKQSRKFVGSVIDGARLYANKAVKEAVSKVMIDPDDIDSAKAFIVTSTNAVIDNTLDRYKSSILEGISE
jgi:hypothetical protein